MANDHDLQDLVDNPRETLEVETKRQLDLADGVHRADLARHICALANHGGGFIVFGFDDNLKPVALSDGFVAKFHRDDVSAIANKYLQPPPLCNVEVITSAAGAKHPIIQVPAHGAVPICAKANGPEDKGRPQGIVGGWHYSRRVGANGPESAPITSPDDWRPVIRRCAIADRTEILGMISGISAMISGIVDTRATQQSAQPAQPPADELKTWHEAAGARYAQIVDKEQLPWRTPLKANYAQYSYQLVMSDRELIPAKELLSVLQRANAAVRDRVWTGWSMFYPFAREEIAPYFVNDAAPEGIDVLECQLVGRRKLTESLPDFWRVSTDGKATIVRPYREDRSKSPFEPGTVLSPSETARQLAEICRHALAMAVNFKSVRAVRFRSEWRGIENRVLRDDRWNFKKPSRVSQIISNDEVSLGDLDKNWPQAVSDLMGRLVRAFDPTLNLDERWVRHESSSFRNPYLSDTG